MKRFKNLLIMLVLAFAMVGLVGTTGAKAADPETPPHAVDYEAETIEITAAGDVYYILKAKGASVKPSSLIKAEKYDGKAIIDISTITSGKDMKVGYYIGDVDASDKTPITVTLIEIGNVPKKVSVALDYSVENLSSKIANAISSITIDGDVYKKEMGESGLKFKKDTVELPGKLQVKKDKNGTWKDLDTFPVNDALYASMKNNGTTLYFRYINPDEDKAHGYTKEVKVKLPKSGKAPSVKIDYAKGTVGIKGGMEFRVPGTEQWLTLLGKKDKKVDGAEELEVKYTKVYKIGDGTKTPYKSLTIAELVKLYNELVEEEERVAAGGTFAIDVRTAATSKKASSNYTTVELTAPADISCTATLVAVADKDAKGKDSLTISFKDKVYNADKAFNGTIEYILINSAKAEADDTAKANALDFTKTKWTKLTADELKLTKGVDVKLGADGKTHGKIEMKDIDAIIFRVPAVNDKNAETKAFASNVFYVALTKQYTVKGINAKTNVTDTAVNASKDAEVTFTADAAPAGKVFDKWEVTGAKTSLPGEDNTIKVTVGESPITVEAIYKDAAPTT